MQTRSRVRQGFTLIEVLTVIAIIGILVGLLLPAISAARRYVAQNAIVFDVQTLGNAIDQYNSKYGDYPPDGSNRSTFERHFRKAFPNMAATEFQILYSVSNNTSGVGVGLAPGDTVMDPAEALVFCLGGFSDDPVHPFTGNGGPLSQVPGVTPAVWQYNVDRSNPIYDFKQSQLTLFVDQAANRTISNDEGLLSNSPADNDLLPVYRPGGQQAPFVYFDNRTYSFAYGSSYFFNVYYAPAVGGYARPYKSDDVNTNVPGPAASNNVSVRDAYVRYANDSSFQIISAGLDDNYGGVAQQSGAPPRFYKYPSGNAVDIMNPTGSGFSRYTEEQGIRSAQLDNATNFADGILENAIEN